MVEWVKFHARISTGNTLPNIIEHGTVLHDDMCMFVGVGAIRQIASEVVQYVMGKASQLQGKHVGETIEDQGTMTEPDLLTAAMDHQQHRAEVSDDDTVSFSL